MITPGRESSAFGALLKAFRTRRRLTQQQLAEAIGMHRHAIVRWEQGDVLPAHKTMVLHLDEPETRRLLEASLTALSPYWLVPFRAIRSLPGVRIMEVLHMYAGLDRPEPPDRVCHS